MKDIKDYLHLYLGCDCMIGDLNWKRDEHTYGLMPDVDLDYGKPIKSKLDAHVLSVFAHKTTLILRPLSDMTEEEAVEFIHRKHRAILCNIDRTEITKVSFGETKNIIRFNYFKKQGSGAQGGGNTYYVNASDPEQFYYLLSRGFDLFNLIQKGLAIDKTKLPNQ